MEEDDEIQSHPSPESRSSESSPRSNGLIMVTVASATPLKQQTSENNLALSIPQQQQTRNGNGGGGREDCWSEGATLVLINAWGERYFELSRGNLRQKHWKEVADIVNSREDYSKNIKTDIQCKNRIDTVKKKYKSEKTKIAAGGGPSKWHFFKLLDELIGSAAKIAAFGGGPVNLYNNFLHQSKTQKVPVGIPVGIRGGSSQFQGGRDQKHHMNQQLPLRSEKLQHKRGGPVNSDSSRESSPTSTDSFPLDIYDRKRPRTGREMNLNVGKVGCGVRTIGGRDVVDKDKKGWGSAVRELTQAILRFGEAYEQAESLKMDQVVEMEKQRMKFTKDLELQRMQFFMKTQLEISQLKHGRGDGIGNASSPRNINNNNNNNNNNNSDISS